MCPFLILNKFFFSFLRAKKWKPSELACPELSVLFSQEDRERKAWFRELP